MNGYLALRTKQFKQVEIISIFDILAKSQDIAQCLIAKAIEQCKRALEVDPNFPWAHSVLGDVYIQKSMYQEAISEKELALDSSGGSPEFLAELAYAHGFSGNREEVEKILIELQEREKEEYVPVCEVAFAYISIHEREDAGCFGENKQKGLVEGTLPSQRNRD